MIIRKATQQDALSLAECLLLAMKDIINSFIGSKDNKKATAFLHHFTQRSNNQYSFENCVVAEEYGKIVAAVCIYDGAKLQELRTPITEYLRTELGRVINPEEETAAGEFYIDSLGVTAGQQGKGTGTQLLQYLINKYVLEKRKTLGLLVDTDNPNAKKLYLKLGFKSVGMKTLAGKSLEHLQINPNEKFRHL